MPRKTKIVKNKTSVMAKPNDDETLTILKKVISEIEQQFLDKKKPTLVFDLDSTLFDVTPRIGEILIAFESAHFHRLPPSEQQALKEIQLQKGDWGLGDAVQRIGAERISKETQLLLKSFWREHFFSNAFLKFDRPFEGAVDFVNDLHALGANIYYLTGRDHLRMGPGSVESLIQHQFPLNETSAKLVLKPKAGMDDSQYKLEWFQTNANQVNNGTIWFFENEPANIWPLIQHTPHVKVIFFDSTHSRRAQVPDHLPKITHFKIKGGS
jgi:hypothetical protein